MPKGVILVYSSKSAPKIVSLNEFLTYSVIEVSLITQIGLSGSTSLVYHFLFAIWILRYPRIR